MSTALLWLATDVSAWTILVVIYCLVLGHQYQSCSTDETVDSKQFFMSCSLGSGVQIEFELECAGSTAFNQMTNLLCLFCMQTRVKGWMIVIHGIQPQREAGFPLTWPCFDLICFTAPDSQSQFIFVILDSTYIDLATIVIKIFTLMSIILSTCAMQC